MAERTRWRKAIPYIGRFKRNLRGAADLWAQQLSNGWNIHLRLRQRWIKRRLILRL